MLCDLLCIAAHRPFHPAPGGNTSGSGGGGGGKDRRGEAGRAKERHVLSLYLSPYSPTLPLHQHLSATTQPQLPVLPASFPSKSHLYLASFTCTLNCPCRLFRLHLLPLLSTSPTFSRPSPAFLVSLIRTAPPPPAPQTHSHPASLKKKNCVVQHVTVNGESNLGNAIQPDEK